MGNSWRRSAWRRCPRCLCGGRWRRVWHGRSWQGGTSPAAAHGWRRASRISYTASTNRWYTSPWRSGGSARLAVAGDQLSGELVRTVTELALGNRYVLLDVPYGGDTLANQLRREYGVSLLLSPTRQQMEEADVLVLFAARTDLRRRDPAVLRLYDEAAPLPPLLLPPVLEGQMPPGLCRPQLLAVLVESGVLRPGQITVGTAES